MPSQAKVKAVLSGDTVVLVSINNPNEEKILSLAYVSAPRMRREGDEPFAYQSREYLREATIGKIVQFTTLYTIPTGTKREYGSISIRNGLEFPAASVEAGWVKIRDDAGRKDDSEQAQEFLDALKQKETTAKSNSRGIWTSGGGMLETAYEIPNPQEFVEKYKGKPLKAVVERVLAGDRMLVRFLLSSTKHIQTLVMVAGIKAPSTSRTPAEGKPIPAEPFGPESHHFVDSRMLHRLVEVNVLGLTPQNVLVCEVNHPNGSIAKFIVEAGLARCIDFHSTMLGPRMGDLRKAENKAKAERLGIHKGYVEQAKPGAGELDATVTRVQNADTVYIKDRSGDERRVSISSIRQPKPKDPQQAPFSADAKEFLRKKLIGKHVKVTVDGRKAATEGFEEQDAVTILVNNKNIALQLVEAGYASAIRHGKDSKDRSPIWDDIFAAEATAQAEGKGMWSKTPPAAKVYQDYSESLQKAKIQASVLQRQKRIPGVVDYVKGGSRFTVLVPRENAKLTLVISGIRCPKSARSPNEKSEPFGQEAHDFANRRCLQRDVEFEVETTDKTGGFIGSLYVGRENFAKLLLEEGLASVHGYSAEQSGNATELFAAEQKAKDARKGMWHDYDPTQDANLGELSISEPANTNDTNGTEMPRKKDYRDVMVSHIDPVTAHLKLQQIGPAHSQALTKLMSSFATYHKAPPTSEKSLPGAPKAGDLVAARFSEDREWYRAKIRRNDREAKKADVLFIDYGNSETLPWSELRPLNKDHATTVLKPQAIDAGMSFLQFPTRKDYLADAVGLMTEITADKQLVASVDAEEKDGSWWITLFDPTKENPGEEDSVNAEVVREGLATVGKELKGWERGRTKVLEGLKKKEAEARADKAGMFEYGDISDDE